jgi:hypothetical protein
MLAIKHEVIKIHAFFYQISFEHVIHITSREMSFNVWRDNFLGEFSRSVELYNNMISDKITEYFSARVT